MVFIPRWISHLCYNSHHFGPLVADTVFGNHYFEMEHCHCRCFNGHFLEIIDRHIILVLISVSPQSGKPLPSDLFPITHTDGVITIEIINCQPSDSGKYKCVATNSLGSDTTDCVVIVEGEYKYFLEIKYFFGNSRIFLALR